MNAYGHLLGPGNRADIDLGTVRTRLVMAGKLRVAVTAANEPQHATVRGLTVLARL
ncbi:hypothetical protein [Sphaerisporangium perillae]|uniref:hypothetical protein n=1 Tax=Sphaerisporangium perillae TaxID=2935860 RepID=UPI00200F7C21|nr:hypothetical protein [Sphaerisporangium perillae]